MRPSNVKINVSYTWGLLAVLMSWAINKSIWWAIFHFVVAFFYVPYWLIRYSSLIDGIKQWVVK